jgi:hypothetical protein
MSEIESTDRDRADEGALEGRETYEPPRITSLGTVDELTSGTSGPRGGDGGDMSIGIAAKGRPDASANAP